MRLSEGALGRHAPARRLCPRAGGQSGCAAAGRAFFGFGRGSTAETLRGDFMDLWTSTAAIPTQGIVVRLAQHRGGGRSRRPHHLVFGERTSRPYPRRKFPMPDLARPRLGDVRRSATSSTKFYTLLTTVPGREGGRRGGRADMLSMQYRLPDASIQQLVRSARHCWSPSRSTAAPTCRISSKASTSPTEDHRSRVGRSTAA